ncbi:MAG: Glutathionyl-hydroquinone reductase YqjG [Chroococcopsis gigantea SAG 12.99]|jgi:putative glutathione S-transferase|nr:glutathione S-transferase family protein [Chlorogloea purpurea SAG 13.99]MDV3001774.1 Glutathionyl-hydroquinone reductase YqjG [Chroococcopsis gigantea SAG 12.99]
MATGMMIEGKWINETYKLDEKGRFMRTPTSFRRRVTSDGSSEFTPDFDRYHLYVSYACPWAHRTLIMRQLKGLQDAISISVVSPLMLDDGWSFEPFPDIIPDTINGVTYLRDIYSSADHQYTGRVTVPILWDKKTGTIVNNESREIIRMLDHEFNGIAQNKTDFCPEELRESVDETIEKIYQPINNGVYRAGFAQSQEAYEEAIEQLFSALDYWDNILSQKAYLCGEQLTEADVCLFTTLLRFDPVYYGFFKCNLRHIWDYDNLWRYLKVIYHYGGIKETCNMTHIKHHYYRSHPQINPSGIVPVGPIFNL